MVVLWWCRWLSVRGARPPAAARPAPAANSVSEQPNSVRELLPLGDLASPFWRGHVWLTHSCVRVRARAIAEAAGLVPRPLTPRSSCSPTPVPPLPAPPSRLIAPLLATQATRPSLRARRQRYDCTASRFRWSMKTCKLTSSVKRKSLAWPPSFELCLYLATAAISAGVARWTAAGAHAIAVPSRLQRAGYSARCCNGASGSPARTAASSCRLGRCGLAGGRHARVELGKEEAGLRAVLVALDVHGHGEALLQQHGGVLLGSREQLAEVGVLRVLMVALLAPCRDGLPVEDDDLPTRPRRDGGGRAVPGGAPGGLRMG